METILELLANHPGIWAFALLVLCGLGLPPWSEEIIILSTGYFVAEGDLTLVQAMLWCLAGILAGDSVIYLLGSLVGEKVYGWPIVSRHLKDPGRRHKFNRLFIRHGTSAVFAARFLPGFRMLAYFVVGNLGMPYWKFALLDGIGALLSVPISVYLGYKLAANLEGAMEIMHRYQIPLAILGVVLIFVLLRHAGTRRKQKLEQIQRERAQRESTR
jgi:membrane protein DedA with SNARE-associated domain